MNGRTILFIGDSILFQMYTSIVCSLYLLTETNLSLPFYVPKRIMKRDQKLSEIDKLCPFKKKHCYLDSAESRFTHDNLTMAYIRLNKFDSIDIFNVVSERFQLQSNDVVLIQFGSHYNNEEISYFQALEKFKRELLMDTSNFLRKCGANLFFLESAPQHFPTKTGDFEEYVRKNPKVGCVMKPDNISDWRNDNLHRLLGKLTDLITIVPIAKALWNQNKQTIGYSRYAANDFGFADCTHYCYPSGIFRYTNQVIYNYLLQYTHRKNIM